MSIIASEMLLQLAFIYEKRRIEELKIKKLDFKIIIDSLTEQIIQYIFHLKPNGIINAREIINKNDLFKLHKQDRIVAEALNAVLKDYNEVFTKQYIDISDRINNFIDDALLNLSKALLNHKSLKNDINAKKLIGILL